VFYAFTFVLCNTDLFTYLLTFLLSYAINHHQWRTQGVLVLFGAGAILSLPLPLPLITHFLFLLSLPFPLSPSTPLAARWSEGELKLPSGPGRSSAAKLFSLPFGLKTQHLMTIRLQRSLAVLTGRPARR